MTKLRVPTLLSVALALSVAWGASAFAEETCQIDSNTRVTPAECMAHGFAECDEDYRHVVANCQKSTSRRCYRGCCTIAAEAQRQVCRANACIAAIDACPSTGVCSCMGTLGGALMRCGMGPPSCRDGVLHECFDDCKQRGWDEEATYVPDFGCAGLEGNEKIVSCADLREKVPSWAAGSLGWRPDIECPTGKEALFDAVSGQAYCGTPGGPTPSEAARDAGGRGPLVDSWADLIACPPDQRAVLEGPTGKVSCEPR